MLRGGGYRRQGEMVVARRRRGEVGWVGWWILGLGGRRDRGALEMRSVDDFG